MMIHSAQYRQQGWCKIMLQSIIKTQNSNEKVLTTHSMPAIEHDSLCEVNEYFSE